MRLPGTAVLLLQPEAPCCTQSRGHPTPHPHLLSLSIKKKRLVKHFSPSTLCLSSASGFTPPPFLLISLGAVASQPIQSAECVSWCAADSPSLRVGGRPAWLINVSGQHVIFTMEFIGGLTAPFYTGSLRRRAASAIFCLLAQKELGRPRRWRLVGFNLAAG